MHYKSAPVSSNDSINTNQRQVSLTGTDHYDSKLAKVVQFEKKITEFFNISENLQENHPKNYISGIFWTFKCKF